MKNSRNQGHDWRYDELMCQIWKEHLWRSRVFQVQFWIGDGLMQVFIDVDAVSVFGAKGETRWKRRMTLSFSMGN